MATFDYVIYIRASADDIWHALTDPDTTETWWHVRFDTTWHHGATYDLEMPNVVIRDPEQLVLVSERPWRLSYTWHTFTPEWAAASNIDDSTRAAFAAEPRSTASLSLEPSGGVTRLHVAHSSEVDGRVLAAVRDGWPPLLSSLKSLLETGKPLEF